MGAERQMWVGALQSLAQVTWCWVGNLGKFRRRRPVVTLQTPQSTAFGNMPNSACTSATRKTNVHPLRESGSDDNAGGSRKVVEIAMIYTPQRTCLIGAVCVQVVMNRRRDILVDNIHLLSTPTLDLPIPAFSYGHSIPLICPSKKKKKILQLQSKSSTQQTSITYKPHPDYPIRKV